MPDCRGEGSVRRGEGLHCANEIRQGNRPIATVAMPRLVKPDDAMTARHQRIDEACHLCAAAAPAVDQQNGRGARRTGAPDRKRMLTRRHELATPIDGGARAPRVTWRHREQLLGLTTRE